MAADQGLAGHKVLVTRPFGQSQHLVRMIGLAGGEALVFPVIEIAPIEAERWHGLSLDGVDWLVFISRNAVECFLKGWRKPLPAGIKLAAVGEGTARAMETHGLRVDLQPARSTGSEGLLATAAMHEVAGKKMLIVRGGGGRELLADTLKARGANIDYVEVYRRTLPVVDDDSRVRALTVDRVVCTSVVGVDNLCSLLGADIEALTAKPLVVLSERIKQHALSLGFKRVLVTDDASDEAIVEQLMRMGG
jgi:uroporphyrinogen-III synthase